MRSCRGRPYSCPESVWPLGHIPVPETAGLRICSAATTGFRGGNTAWGQIRQTKQPKDSSELALRLGSPANTRFVDENAVVAKEASASQSPMAVRAFGSVGRRRGRSSHKEERQDVATGPTEQDASRAETQGRPRTEGSPKGQGPESKALTAIGLYLIQVIRKKANAPRWCMGRFAAPLWQARRKIFVPPNLLSPCNP